MQSWGMFGSMSYSVSLFKLERTNGKTLFEIDSTNYNHSLVTARIT